MLEAGILAFRAWEDREGHTNHPEEAYPFYDPTLERCLQVVYVAMAQEAHSVS
jgi:hypothetical protein